jgi:hypothetical protein
MADTFAIFKTSAVVLDPIPASTAPVGSLYNDSSNSNVFSNKTTTGDNQQIGASTEASLMVKLKKNMTGVAIAAYKRVALHTDGTMVLADSDNVSAMLDIGITIDPVNTGSFGRVLLNGANADGVLTGLGFTSGQAIFLSKTPGGLVNDVGSFNPATDTIMRVGIADCANNVASGTATDLIMTIEVYSRPGGA